MALATLSIDLIAKLASLEAGLDRAARINQKTAADIESRWTRVGSTLRTVGGLVGGAFATQQLAGFIDRTIDGLDKLNDVADSTGSSVEKISALEDIGARTGTGIDAIEGSLVKFNAALKEADGKNGVSQALKAIGVDAERLKQLDPADALLETAQALARYQDDGTKARIVQDLFGKSVREVGPYLKDLAAAGQLNATVTKEQAAEAEKFNNQLFALQKNVSDAARSFVSELLPALNSYFDSLNKAGGFSGSIASRLGLDEQGQLESKAATLRAEITRTGDTIARFGEELSRDPENAVLSGRLDKARARLADLQRQAAATSEKLKGVADALDPTRGRRPPNEGGGGYNPPRINEPAAAGGEAKISEAQRYLENLQKQLEKTRDLSNYEQALADIQNKRIDGLTPKLQAEILEKARLLDLAGKTREIESRQASFRQAELQAQEAVNKALVSSQEAVADRARTVNELLAATPSKQLEVTRIEIQRLYTAFENSKLSAEELEEALHGVLGISKQVGEEVTAFSQQAAANIQDALGASTLSILEGKFKGIGDLFENMVNRMVSEAVAADLAKRLFGEGYGKSTNEIGGLVGQGFDYLKGAFGGGSAGTAGNNPSAYTAGGGGGGFGGAIGNFLTLFSGFFADGGRIPPGKFGAVGEEGLELAYGGSTGLNIVPLGKGSQGGGRTQQINYAPTFVLQAPASRETQEQVAAMAFGGAQEAWSRQS